MRTFTATMLLLLTIGCATSGTVGPTQYYETDFEIVWAAALDAAHGMGARVQLANRNNGIIAAKLAAAELGGGVQLNISVNTGHLRGAEVQVNATMPDSEALAESRKEDLRFLEEQYMELVDMAVAQLAARSGRGLGSYR